MKKSLIIVLIIISVVSIFALGILIPKVEQTIVTVKVTGVSFSNEEITLKEELDDNGSQMKRIELVEGTSSFQLEWKVFPYDEENKKSDATTPDVTFLVTGSTGVTIDSKGLLSFPKTLDKSLSVTVKVTTIDGNKTDYVEIFIKHDVHHGGDDF